jgi:hypothetical protein
MKHNCTPPYENCVHGHFYRAALEAGVNEREAERWTENLKELHNENFPNGYDVTERIEQLQSFVGTLPASIRQAALRVIRWMVGKWIYLDYYSAIYDIDPNSFEGETIIFSYEDWKNERLPYSTWWFGYGESKLHNETTLKIDTWILPKEEHEKIVAKRKEIAQDHIQKNLDWYIAKFEERLSKSEEKERLLTKNIETLEKALFDKGFTSFKVWYAIGNMMTPGGAQYSSTSKYGWFNEIAYWTNDIKIEANHEVYEFINPKDEENYSREIVQVNAVVLFEYKKYLESKLAALQNPTKPNIEKQSPELTFADLFISPDAMQKAIELAQKSTLINSNFQYNFGSKGKYAIVAYWHFLKDQTNPTLIKSEYRNSGQKACEAIAAYFKTKIGKELYQQNHEAHGVLPSPSKGFTFYIELVRSFGNRESFG